MERQEALFEAYGKAAGCEIRHRADEITSDVNTLYIGGGTPSVLPLSVYSSIMEDLASVGAKAPFDEFTFEVNPEDIVEKGRDYVRGLVALGVNRFSMGVQSFDDGILRWMNRRHDSATARQAYGILRESGIDNISIDLIFGLPQLSDEQWRQTLKQALEIAPDGIPPKHISAYQLSVEPGSALQGWWKGECGPRHQMSFASVSTPFFVRHWSGRDTIITRYLTSRSLVTKPSITAPIGGMSRMWA